MMKLFGALSIVEAPDHSYDELNGDWLIDTDRYVIYSPCGNSL